MLLPAPGAVLALEGRPTLTSINLTWNPPEEPNGVIIAYEVTFDTDISSNTTITNTTDLRSMFTISSLTPGTRVSGISVTAYTTVGPGEIAVLDDIVTLTEPHRLHAAIKG